jgi:hypothetical protein
VDNWTRTPKTRTVNKQFIAKRVTADANVCSYDDLTEISKLNRYTAVEPAVFVTTIKLNETGIN